MRGVRIVHVPTEHSKPEHVEITQPSLQYQTSSGIGRLHLFVIHFRMQSSLGMITANSSSHRTLHNINSLPLWSSPSALLSPSFWNSLCLASFRGCDCSLGYSKPKTNKKTNPRREKIVNMDLLVLQKVDFCIRKMEKGKEFKSSMVSSFKSIDSFCPCSVAIISREDIEIWPWKNMYNNNVFCRNYYYYYLFLCLLHDYFVAHMYSIF